MSVYKLRRKGRGGIERDRWMIDLTIDRPGVPRVRIQRVAREQNERGALREERELIAAVHAGTWTASRAKAPEPEPTPTDAVAVEGEGAHKPEAAKEPETFAAFSKRWLEVYATTNNKPSEAETKASILRLHLGPVFNALKLSEINLARIEQYKASKLRAGLKPKTVNNHLTVLHKLLDVAHDWEELAVVPRIRWLRAAEPEARHLDFREAEALIAGALDHWRPLIKFGLRTGLRVGEVIGLRWVDVDLKRSRIVVRRAITRGRVGTPKSGKPREVDLSPATVEMLRAMKHLRGEYVFCRENGRPLSTGTIKAALKTASRRAGLEMVHWHTLRHTFASHLVMRGAPIKTVQKLLGHAKSATTDRYAHLSPGTTRDAIGLLDGHATPTLLRASGSD